MKIFIYVSYKLISGFSNDTYIFVLWGTVTWSDAS